jgi:hypothetical protein
MIARCGETYTARMERLSNWHDFFALLPAIRWTKKTVRMFVRGFRLSNAKGFGWATR